LVFVDLKTGRPTTPPDNVKLLLEEFQE
jgi:acyl-CoA thioesterase FadM